MAEKVIGTTHQKFTGHTGFSMALINAHIRNVDYEFVEIVIRDDITGAIVGNKIFFEAPSSLSLQAAKAWVADHYSTENTTITTEGFDEPLPTNTVNEEGVVCLSEKKPELEWPSLDQYVVDNNLPLESQEQVENALSSYTQELDGINICMPVQSEEEAQLYSSEPEPSSLMSQEDEFVGPPAPEDEVTDTGFNMFAHAEWPDLEKYTHEGSEELNPDDFNQAARNLHSSLARGEQLKPKPVNPMTNDSQTIPKSKKSAIDMSGFSKTKSQRMQVGPRSPSSKRDLSKAGIAGDVLNEPVPVFDSAKYDNVISNKNNAFICLTRDRNSNLLSGYGGKGNTGAAAIDIVCGRMGNNPMQVNKDSKPIKVNPFFVPTKTDLGTVVDSARIYISQKADIDDYFKLVEGRVGNSVERSSVALKADAVRIIGNEGIKLVTKTDSINSKGGRIKKNRGVDIIANNDDAKLQPMILGNNMQKCVSEMAEMINNMIGALQATINNVAQLDVALASHVHVSPFYGAPTLPSPNGAPMCIASLIELVSVESFSTAAQKWNVNTFRWKYLKQGSPLTIRSKYNNVN